MSAMIRCFYAYADEWRKSLSRLDLMRVATDSMYLGAATGVSGAAALMVSLIFTRLSTPEMYGQYRYIFSILGVIALFSLPGMNVAIARSSARGFDGTLWEGTKARLRFALLGSAVLVAIAGLLAYQGRPVLARAALVGAVLFPLLWPLDSYLFYFNGKRQFRRFATFTAVLALAPLLVLLVTVLVTDHVEYVILTNLLTVAGLNVMLMLHTLRGVGYNQPVDVEGLRYGWRVSGVNVIGTVHAHLANLVVGTFLGFTDLALFTVGTICAEMFKKAMDVLNLQMFPRLAAADKRDARVSLRRSLLIGFPVMLLTGMIVFVSLPVLVPLVFTAQYRESILYARVLIAGVILSFPGNQFNTYLASRGQARAQYRLLASALLVELVSLIILARQLGLLGVALAKSTVWVWQSLYGWWLVRRFRE